VILSFIGMSKKYWPSLSVSRSLPGLSLLVDHDDEANHWTGFYQYLKSGLLTHMQDKLMAAYLSVARFYGE
jgi:hypothetical protein